MSTEPLPDAVRPEHLTDVLRRAGVLGNARVSEVVVISAHPTILSSILRLGLTYDGDAADAPRSVIFKTGLPNRVDGGWVGGSREVAFYTQLAPEMPDHLVPRCFAGSADEATKAWHLLLEDLTDSHVIATTWPLPPTIEQCNSIMQARARIHAAWWDDPRLGSSIGTWLDADSLDRSLQHSAEQFARFTDLLGDRLPPVRRALYERLFAEAPRLFARYHSHRNLTVIQGDSHVWNCFLPRDGGSDVRFFDWDSWRIGTATGDLAYMMAIHWYPDQRQRLERSLLDCYHAALLAAGVDGYDRHALDDDYRLSVLWQITTPIWQAAYDIPPVIWWNNLERIFLAVDDLGCRDLLG